MIHQPSPDLHASMQPAERNELISPPPFEAMSPEDLEASPNSPGYAPTTLSPQSTMPQEIEAIPAADVPVPETPVQTPDLSPEGVPDTNEETELPPLDDDSALVSQRNILSCFHVQHFDESTDPLLEVSTLEPGMEECSLLLAEDDLPFVTDPVVCHKKSSVSC